MITYHEVPGKAQLQLKVKLDNKVVGGIYKTHTDKFYYKPTGRTCGTYFNSLVHLKTSLEAPDDN